MVVIKMLLQRLTASMAIIIGITLIAFLLSFLIPADPVRMLAGRSATQETVASNFAEAANERNYPAAPGSVSEVSNSPRPRRFGTELQTKD